MWHTEIDSKLTLCTFVARKETHGHTLRQIQVAFQPSRIDDLGLLTLGISDVLRGRIGTDIETFMQRVVLQ
jgi:hypothetical protein